MPLVCVAAAIPVAGCGGDENQGPLVEPAKDIEQPSDLLVTSEDIKEANPDSPYGRLLGWWQALQFENIPKAQTYFAKDAPRPNFANIVREITGLGQSRPIVVEENEAGNRITLLTVVRSASPAASGAGQSAVRVQDAPATFRLVREGGVWKIADNGYLTEKLRSQREFEAKRQRQQQAQP